MKKLLQWLFGKQYRFTADIYDPGSGGGSEWREFSGLFRWGGLFNRTNEGRVFVGAYKVCLKPIRIAGCIRWELKQVFKRGTKTPVFYVDNIKVTKEGGL